MKRLGLEQPLTEMFSNDKRLADLTVVGSDRRERPGLSLGPRFGTEIVPFDGAENRLRTTPFGLPTCRQDVHDTAGAVVVDHSDQGREGHGRRHEGRGRRTPDAVLSRSFREAQGPWRPGIAARGLPAAPRRGRRRSTTTSRRSRRLRSTSRRPTSSSCRRTAPDRTTRPTPVRATSPAEPCPSCSLPLVPGAMFCGECGTRVTSPADAAPGRGAARRRGPRRAPSARGRGFVRGRRAGDRLLRGRRSRRRRRPGRRRRSRDRGERRLRRLHRRRRGPRPSRADDADEADWSRPRARGRAGDDDEPEAEARPRTTRLRRKLRSTTSPRRAGRGRRGGRRAGRGGARGRAGRGGACGRRRRRAAPMPRWPTDAEVADGRRPTARSCRSWPPARPPVAWRSPATGAKAPVAAPRRACGSVRPPRLPRWS